MQYILDMQIFKKKHQILASKFFNFIYALDYV